eukprot:5781393-Lingulodinium_polyedra.AAC.1
MARPMLASFWDGKAFFDSLSMQEVLMIGHEMGYPKVILALAALVHLAPRFLKSEGCVDPNPVD